MTGLFDLSGKKGLVVGIANANSVAYGCARAFRAQGADLALTYLNDKAHPHVAPLAEDLGASLLAPLDVRVDGMLEDLFAKIRDQWGRLDFLLHSIAFADRKDLHGRVTDCSQGGFGLAMDVSCHSFIRMVQAAEPLMSGGGSALTVTFYGAEKVVSHYNVMGPVKAALEASTRYLAAELGNRGITVNAISPGPLATRAASGIDRFDELLDQAAQRAPDRQLVTIDEIGALAAYLVSDGARAVTGNTLYIDHGYHIMA